MKKFGVALVALLLCLAMTGCVSYSDYKELEERVRAIEAKIINNNANQTEPGSESDEITGSGSDANKVPYNYFLDSMSDDEVVDECLFYFLNVPYQGQTYESYYSTFKVEPILKTTNGIDCYFYDHSLYPNASNDVITRIYIDGTQAEMDGSIGYSRPYYIVGIDLTIQNYDRAARIYDSLYKVLINDYFIDIHDDSSSTTWHSNAGYIIPGYGGSILDFLKMEKTNYGFNISACYCSNEIPIG